MNVMIARIFNIAGPGQAENLLPMTFIRQIGEMKTGHNNILRVGNVEPTRDFVDVRDIASAFSAIIRNGKSGEVYNVASGSEISINDLIMRVIQLGGMDVSIVTECDRVRATDVPRVLADISKINSHTGWKPSIPLEDSLRDMWDRYS